LVSKVAFSPMQKPVRRTFLKTPANDQRLTIALLCPRFFEIWWDPWHSVNGLANHKTKQTAFEHPQIFVLIKKRFGTIQHESK